MSFDFLHVYLTQVHVCNITFDKFSFLISLILTEVDIKQYSTVAITLLYVFKPYGVCHVNICDPMQLNHK